MLRRRRGRQWPYRHNPTAARSGVLLSREVSMLIAWCGGAARRDGGYSGISLRKERKGKEIAKHKMRQKEIE